jgi:hypothetical protein
MFSTLKLTMFGIYVIECIKMLNQLHRSHKGRDINSLADKQYLIWLQSIMLLNTTIYNGIHDILTVNQFD